MMASIEAGIACRDVTTSFNSIDHTARCYRVPQGVEGLSCMTGYIQLASDKSLCFNWTFSQLASGDD